MYTYEYMAHEIYRINLQYNSENDNGNSKTRTMVVKGKVVGGQIELKSYNGRNDCSFEW